MRFSRLRAVASALTLVFTGVLFVLYFQKNPQYVTSLKEVSSGFFVAILVVNLMGVTTLAVLLQVLLRMSGHSIPWKENWLLTAYSSIANFFGPLQSGPGVRAVYLKAKYKVSLGSYLFVTLIAYAIYAAVSAFCLFVGSGHMLVAVIAALIAVLVSARVIQFFEKRESKRFSRVILAPKLVILLVCLTCLQIMCIGLRYYLAMRASGFTPSLGEIVSYTGAANFALFVSITPDGIGIREAFLFVAQSLHHVPSDVIVVANLIDRAAYVVFLGGLFVCALAMHAKDRFTVESTDTETVSSSD